jgi:phosphate transport system ATP-binding protein
LVDAQYSIGRAAPVANVMENEMLENATTTAMNDTAPSAPPIVTASPVTTTAMTLRDVAVAFNGRMAVRDATFDIAQNRVTSLIGPSGSGKTTLLRALNRLHDRTPSAKVTGEILLEGTDIHRGNITLTELRARVGMVFQRPNPFPTMSIHDNVISGLKFGGVKKKAVLDEALESSLKAAALWDEVDTRLKDSAASLSGGQQQRLCIARALAMNPEVLLMDEPTSALDPVATLRIEELMSALKERVTIIIVTHNMQQAARISDDCAFLLMGEDRAGELIEFSTTQKIFNDPADARTLDYISGRFG